MQVKHQHEHISLDMQKIVDERSSVEKAVEDKTSVQRSEASSRETKREVIRQEIEDLMARLKAKREDEARITSEIEGIERQIADITSQYEAKLSKLDERRARVKVQVCLHGCWVCIMCDGVGLLNQDIEALKVE